MRPDLINEKLVENPSGSNSARRLSLLVIVIATAIIVMVPLAFDPEAIILHIYEAFYLIKFQLLLGLSAALLVGVLGATLLGASFARIPILLPALAFLVASTLSTLLSDDIIRSLIGRFDRFDGLLSLAAGIVLFYATARFLDSWAKVRVFLIAGVTSAIIVSIYGILQHYRLDPVLSFGVPWRTFEPMSGTLAPLYALTDRVFSTLGWPIYLASYLTLMMGATLALYFDEKKRWERGVWLAALAIISVCWLYTYTRGAMLGVGATVLIILFLARHRLGSVRPLILPLAVVAVAMLAAQLLSPYPTNVLTRIEATNLASAPEEVPEGGDTSTKTRLLMWRDTVPVIMERPLLGHGPDNSEQAFARYEGEDLRALLFGEEVVDKAHNELLQVAATTGLLGLVAYLWIFVSYFRHAYRSGGWPLLALSGGVLAYILQLQTAFTTIATGVTFWAILGVSVAIMRLQDRENAKEEPKPLASESMEAAPGAEA